jgi:hypothetical protein
VSAEYDFEPIRGLPGDLPAGETLLWQGAPGVWALATRAFHVRAVAGYFALLLGWRAATSLADGATPGAAAVQATWSIAVALAALGLLMLLAWLTARTTVYSITSRRVVMRYGIALPRAINLPFRIIHSAALKPAADGSGDLALQLTSENKIAFLQLWPHARPWNVRAPQPTLRGILDGQAAAALLARAMAAELGQPAVAVSPARAQARRPAAVATGGLEPA